ncbi:MAG: bacillithiol biosynthesis cysteine-adding enzyme BshC [Crocinitomicaceae bacterium]
MKYSFDEFNSSSLLVRSYINKKENVLKYAGAFFDEDTLLKQCNVKEFSKEKRTLLSDRLLAQNSKIKLSTKSAGNIKKIVDNKTFTITTGHQLNMATGPLYTLYKILEVINWCEKLNEKQGENYFVPVFWMATEDHDFEEIKHVNLFGSKIDWQHSDAENTVVGRLNTDPICSFIEQVLSKFNDDELRKKIALFLSTYSEAKTLASANRNLINNLFGNYGLVIIDGDDSELKKAFIPTVKLEIQQGLTYTEVSATDKKLLSDGFHSQVYVRESNLFYIDSTGERIRIEKSGNNFAMNSKIFSKSELLALLDECPERFSPNALLRPIYQESILPNVCYVGGGGEIAYWLQLKSTFEQINLQFPILKVRESVILLNGKLVQQLNDFDYTVLDLKAHIDDVLKDFVTKNQTIELSLADQKTDLEKLKNDVLEKALAIDRNSSSFVAAEFQRMENQLEKIEKKFIATEKKNQEKSLKQIRRLQNSFFPNGSFQERYENYMTYMHHEDFIGKIKGDLKKRMTAKAAIQLLRI